MRGLGRPLGAARGARTCERSGLQLRCARIVPCAQPAANGSLRAVPARSLGSGMCAALPGEGVGGCAGCVPDGAPAADTPPENHLVLRGAEVILAAPARSAWRAGWRWKGENELRKFV